MMNLNEVNTNTPRDCNSCELYALMTRNRRGTLKDRATSGWCKSHCTLARNWSGWFGSEEMLRNQLTRPFEFSKVAHPKLVSLIRKQGKLSVFSRASIEQGLGIRFPISVHTLGHVDAYLRENPPFLALASVSFEIKPGCLNYIDWPGFGVAKVPHAASTIPIPPPPAFERARTRTPERRYFVPLTGSLEVFAMVPSVDTWDICHEETITASWLEDLAQELWDRGTTRENEISGYLCMELRRRARDEIDEEGISHPSLSFGERVETGEEPDYPDGTCGFQEYDAQIDTESTDFREALCLVNDKLEELSVEAEEEEEGI